MQAKGIAFKNPIKFLVFPLLALIIHSLACKSQFQEPIDTSKIEINPVSINADPGLNTNGYFFNMAKKCRLSQEEQSPVLFGQFLNKTLINAITIEDIIENQNAHIYCAPGPYSMGSKNSQPHKKEVWELNSFPDYFIWQTINDGSIYQNFYISDKNGFPVPAKILKLKEGNISTIVLFPKTKVKNKNNYYLYLETTVDDKKNTWIQAITQSSLP